MEYIFLATPAGMDMSTEQVAVTQTPGITTGTLSPGYEALGVAGSGIYTQSGGVNVPFADVLHGRKFQLADAWRQ